jgi:polyribonucleotide 5'-hydroxyl-kinase
MSEYINVHFALETLRNEAKAQGRDGPRVLLLGPTDAGKTSLAKILTAYAIRMGRQPIIANLDPEEGLLSLPGTLTATTFKTILDVEDGWGSSPMSGPSPIPVKLPLVYNYPLPDPTAHESTASYYRTVLSKLALTVSGRLTEDTEAREAGLIIDTPGSLANTTKPLAVNIIQHIVTEFSISHILVLGSERLYSDIVRRFDGRPTSTNNPTTSSSNQEKITVSKLTKSGGTVDRDSAFMRSHRAAQIRSYFFGSPNLTNGISLSPRQQQVNFVELAIYRLLIGHPDSSNSISADLFRPGGQDDEDDSYDPTSTGALSHIPAYDPARAGGTGSGTIFQRLTSLTPALTSHTLAIMNADPDADETEIRDASVLGFVYVAEVDEGRGRISLLSPVGGRIPRRALVWSQRFPEEVVGIV